MSYIYLNKSKTSIKDEIYIYSILNNITNFDNTFLEDELKFYNNPTIELYNKIIYYTNIRSELNKIYQLQNKHHINNIILIIISIIGILLYEFSHGNALPLTMKLCPGDPF